MVTPPAGLRDSEFLPEVRNLIAVLLFEAGSLQAAAPEPQSGLLYCFLISPGKWIIGVYHGFLD